MDAKIGQARKVCVERVDTLSANMKQAVSDIGNNMQVLGDDLCKRIGAGNTRSSSQRGTHVNPIVGPDVIPRIKRAEHRITA